MVALFMVLRYGLFGLFADVALTLNVVLLLAALTAFGATLTLPGIAGIVLTMGMAVDANVLIYERIREEQRNGRAMLASIDTGFRRAMATIIDANMTHLIASLILFELGTGPVKGFAVTLAVGIITSFFTAVMVTRLIVIGWLNIARPDPHHLASGLRNFAWRSAYARACALLRPPPPCKRADARAGEVRRRATRWFPWAKVPASNPGRGNMAAFLGNLRNVVIAGFVLAILLVGVYCATQGFDGPAFELFALRWLHVVSGVMWIGLLWYFNFVAAPTMPKIPDELKPALGRFITPAALFWFRWSAVGTIFFGIILALRNHYLIEAYTLDLSEGAAGWPMVPKYLAIGIGMWLGTIMWFNVWFVIWPNQQKALNIGGKYPDLARRRQGRRGQDGRHVQPHQHSALHPHAVQHGGGRASLLIQRRPQGFRGTACASRRFFF